MTKTTRTRYFICGDKNIAPGETLNYFEEWLDERGNVIMSMVQPNQFMAREVTREEAEAFMKKRPEERFIGISPFIEIKSRAEQSRKEQKEKELNELAAKIAELLKN